MEMILERWGSSTNGRRLQTTVQVASRSSDGSPREHFALQVTVDEDTYEQQCVVTILSMGSVSSTWDRVPLVHHVADRTFVVKTSRKGDVHAAMRSDRDAAIEEACAALSATRYPYEVS